MTIGIGIFMLPHFTKNVGLLTSFVMILLAFLLNYFSYQIIIQATDLS